MIGQKCRTADILTASRRLSRSPSFSEDPELSRRLDDLRQQTGALAAATNQRLDALEQALPLAEHFAQLRTALVVAFEQLDKALRVDVVFTGDLMEQQDRMKVSFFVIWT